MIPSNHLIFCCPLPLLPSIFPSIRVFSNESVLHITWPKYWSFNFSIIPSNEYSGLISFRMDWLDLLAVQGTLKSLLQHHHSKASILQCSAFFIVHLSHPYTGSRKQGQQSILRPLISRITRTSVKLTHASARPVMVEGPGAQDCQSLKAVLSLSTTVMPSLKGPARDTRELPVHVAEGPGVSQRPFRDWSPCWS